MSTDQTQRPKFYEEQYLGAADLTAAVEYGRIQEARHALGGHTWGIAMGLQLKETPQPGGAVSVHLLPGYAWDGYGRPIVVLSPYKIPEEKFSAIKFDPSIDVGAGLKGRLIRLWLRYDELATRNPPPGFEVCGDVDQRSRIQETFRIEIGEQNGTTDLYSGITIAAKSLDDAKKALQVFDPAAPLVYDEAVPHQTFPEPAVRSRWLIPIGYVRWLPVQNKPGHFVARDDGGAGGAEKDTDKIRRVRRYIGAVAEEIEAADSVIRLRDRGRDPASSFFQAPTMDQLAAKTNELANDLVWVEGNLRVIGNAKLCAGKLDFRDQQGLDFKAPLRIQRSEDGTLGVSVLQATIGLESTKNHRFAVGPLKADGSVNERFTVLSNGNVGVGTSAPTLKLDIQGTDFGRDNGPATLHLFGARIGDVGGATLFIRAFAGGAVAFDGVNNRVGIGTIAPISKLQVAGDIALEKMAVGTGRTLPAGGSMLWNDGTWLRLNENLDFSQPVPGVRTRGVLATDSLNVGGAGGFGNPGVGNVWVTGRVGIGTTTPTRKLHVLGDRIRLESTGKFIDIRADGESVDLHSETNDLYIRSSGLGGNNRVLINPFAGDGEVGIGTRTPVAKLDVEGNLRVSGNASKPGGGSWTNSSDIRLKKSVKPISDALGLLLQLRGVGFEWKEPERMGNQTGPQMGLIAQEVEKVLPEWVSYGPEGYKELTVRGFEALTVEAIRELKNEIEDVGARLKKLGTRPSTAGRKRATLKKETKE